MAPTATDVSVVCPSARRLTVTHSCTLLKLAAGQNDMSFGRDSGYTRVTPCKTVLDRVPHGKGIKIWGRKPGMYHAVIK